MTRAKTTMSEKEWLKVRHPDGMILEVLPHDGSYHDKAAGTRVKVLRFSIEGDPLHLYYRCRAVKTDGTLDREEFWLQYDDVQDPLTEEEVKEAVKSIRRSFARPPTQYETPTASDGEGGPHPLAGVPQEVLDAAYKELDEAYSYGMFAKPDDDDIESVAHAVLLAAIQAAKEW